MARPRAQQVYRKEAVFEGFFTLFYDASYISKEYEYTSKDEGNESVRRWRQSCLQDLAEKEREAEEDVSFVDLIPKEVYLKLLQNLGTKFRFRFTVEAEEI